MKKFLTLFSVLTSLLIATPIAVAAQAHTAQSADLDAYWTAVAQTISEGDFEGYAATYHEDAVLVNEGSKSSYPIAQALAGWKQGFDDTKAGTTKASVEFRFTQTYSDEASAHQTGIFHYTATPTVGDVSDYYVHFEALLVNKDGWKLMMEYQKSPATIEEWEQAK